jgi:AcrR family transcriptional regulator
VRARVRLTPEARRAQLLATGIKHFSERSYDDFSIEEVAMEVGVSKALVFHYFPTKRDFYIEALRTASEQMLVLIQTPAGQPAEQALRAALDAYLGYVQERAAAYRAVLRGGIGADSEVQAIADGFRDAVYERVLQLRGEGEPSPRLRTALRGWIGLVEAASLDWVVRRDLAREELVEQLAEALAVLVQAALNNFLTTSPGFSPRLQPPLNPDNETRR